MVLIEKLKLGVEYFHRVKYIKSWPVVVNNIGEYTLEEKYGRQFICDSGGYPEFWSLEG